MVQYRRPSCSSRTESVWSSFGRTVMGKAIWENLIEARLEEGFQLGMLIRTPWKRTILVCVCGRYHNWQERNKTLTQCGKYSWKKSIWASTHHSWTMFIWVALDENAKRAKILWKLQTYVRIQDICRSKRKATVFRETWRRHFFMVLCCARSCTEMCGAILRAGEQNNPATSQHYNTMPWWPSS